MSLPENLTVQYLKMNNNDDFKLLYQCHTQNQCKILSVKKVKGFSQRNTSCSNSWKCLCTYLGHVTDTKTLVNLLLALFKLGC